MALRGDSWLDWHAWRSVARSRVCIAAGIAHGPAISRTRLYFVFRVFSDPRDACFTRPDAAGVNQKARHTARCRDRSRGASGTFGSKQSGAGMDRSNARPV